MKKIITMFVAMLMLLSIIAGAFAEEAVTSDVITTDTATDDAIVTEPATTDVSATEPSSDVAAPETPETIEASDVEAVVEDGLSDVASEETVEAGTTPDSPLWGIERALERIDLALTFSKAKKVEKRLVHARERLLEVQAMAGKGKLKHAARAAEAHAEEMEAAEGDLAEAVEAEGETDKLKTLEERFDMHIQVLERVQAKLQEKGIEAPGIANALAIAKAKKNVVLARQAVKEAKKSGEGLEEAKAGLDEAKTGFKETRAGIRESKKFVSKTTGEEVAGEEATEETSEETVTETTTETSETNEASQEISEPATQ